MYKTVKFCYCCFPLWLEDFAVCQHWHWSVRLIIGKVTTSYILPLVMRMGGKATANVGWEATGCDSFPASSAPSMLGQTPGQGQKIAELTAESVTAYSCQPSKEYSAASAGRKLRWGSKERGKGTGSKQQAQILHVPFCYLPAPLQPGKNMMGERHFCTLKAESCGGRWPFISP